MMLLASLGIVLAIVWIALNRDKPETNDEEH